jgi:type VI protein secretion system component Hcp
MSRVFSTGRARLLVPAIVAAFILAYAAAAALTAGAQTSTTFFGCLDDKGVLTQVVTSLAQPQPCKAPAVAVSWSQTGPAGSQGPQGPQVPAGPAGSSGPGAPNKAVVGRAVVQGITDANGIEIVGFRSGVKQIPGVSGGGGTSKPDFEDLTVVTEFNPASVELFQVSANSMHIPRVTVVVYRPGTTAPGMTYTLTDVTVSSVVDSHTGAVGDAPLEAISFNYFKIESAFTAP